MGGRKQLFCSLLIKKAGEMSGNTFRTYGLTINNLLHTTAIQHHGTIQYQHSWASPNTETDFKAVLLLGIKSQDHVGLTFWVIIYFWVIKTNLCLERVFL